MGFVDLHVHSNASDGTLSPAQVVDRAVSKGLDAIALTDHDTIDGLEEAIRAAEGKPLELVPGIEMSCLVTPPHMRSAECEIHIIGLYIDQFSHELADGLAEIRGIRQKRNERILERFLEDGFILTMDDLTGGNACTVITRAHFARALTEKGYVKDRKQAFDKYLQYGGRYCSRKEVTTPEQVMSILSSAGALPSLAHPMQYHMGYGQIEDLVVYLKDLGLKGIEVYHSSHNQHESGTLREMARRHQLLPTGGSDFHGANKPDIDIGTGRGGLRISHLLLEDIKEVQIGRNI